MKFAREFNEALRREGYPPYWLESAIPYCQLKKCIKKVQKELKGLGLDPDTLRQLLATHAASADGGSVPLASYELCESSKILHPRLTVFVHFKDDGAAVDATLTPTSREFLEMLSAGRLSNVTTTITPNQEESDSVRSSNESSHRESISDTCDDVNPVEEAEKAGGTGAEPTIQRIEVPLVFDGEFFDLLQTDVTSLDSLQEEEETSMSREIADLGRGIASLTKPSSSGFHKSDLSRWREVFELYLDAQVFFSTHERDHGARTSVRALEQLVWFQARVHERQLIQQFKLSASRDAYTKFLDLNSKFLQNLKFQELNKIAMTKILKKFDKRTSLGVSRTFPIAVQSKRFLSESVSKHLCAQISQEVVSVVPRLDDYICPICLSIAWLPVRLNCHHVFCVRCVVKMQRESKRRCPLCRQNVVLQADLRNLDHELTRFMSLYFKKETKEKQKANDIERGIEMFGEGYQHSSCSVM